MNRALARCFPILAFACALAAPTTAGAATKYDTSYQNGGMLQLPQLRGVYGQVAQSCEVTGKNLSIAGRFGRNDAGLPTTWRSDQRLGITAVKVRTRQPMMLGIAEVSWKMQRIPTGHVVLGQDFADDGSFAYATRSQRSGQRSKLKLFRVAADGSRIKTFGRNGYVSITIPGFTKSRPIGFRVIALPRTEVLVIAQTADTQVLLRYTRTGRPDRTWGESGVVELNAPATIPIYPLPDVDSATVTPEGGLLIAANAPPGQTALPERGVLKLTAAGNVATNWAKNGFWTPPASTATKPADSLSYFERQTYLIANRKGGGYAVLYGNLSQSESSVESSLSLAYVDKSSGVTTLFNDTDAGYSAGGDGGFPDSEPWILAPSSSGPILSLTRGYFSNPGGSFGWTTRFSPDADQPAKRVVFNEKGFAASALAVDPAAKFLYLCGGFGVTSSTASDAAKRSQRKSIAIKRIAL